MTLGAPSRRWEGGVRPAWSVGTSALARALRCVATIVQDERGALEREIAEQRSRLYDLEVRLRALDRPETQAPTWPPQGFYLTYYVIAGILLGILGSVTSFAFHVIGSVLVDQDPLRVLRVYGTVFLGESALTTTDLSFFMLVGIAHFSIGAAAGAVFHVLVNRFAADKPASTIIGLGAAYGLVMWIVNFYGILSWLQPRLVGAPYVLQLMPIWIAAATHLIYGLTLGVLQPLGRFVPYQSRTT